jgi:hypothetical protein
MLPMETRTTLIAAYRTLSTSPFPLCKNSAGLTHATHYQAASSIAHQPLHNDCVYHMLRRTLQGMRVRMVAQCLFKRLCHRKRSRKCVLLFQNFESNRVLPTVKSKDLRYTALRWWPGLALTQVNMKQQAGISYNVKMCASRRVMLLR